MNIVLANPFLLPLLAAILVPLLLHLFARARPPIYTFSCTEFIRRLIRQQMRVKKPKDFLLLILRTLLVAALALVFLRPRLFMDRRFTGDLKPKDMVLLLDASASMACLDGAQSRFSQARAQASTILGALRHGDRANVIWLRRHPTAVFPELGENLGFLQDELRRAQVSCEAADIEAGLQAACEMLRDAVRRREICIISDFQRTAWEEVRLTPPPGIGVITLKAGQDDVGNVAVTRLEAQPAVPLAGEEVAILCEIANYSELARAGRVYLEAGSVRQQQDYRVAAWGTAVATFRCTFDTAGSYACGVGLDPDSFPGDDRRWLALDVRETLRVGLVGATSPTGSAWRRALAALKWARCDETVPDAAGTDVTHDILMLAGWSGTNCGGVREFLGRGGTAVWAVETPPEPSALAALCGLAESAASQCARAAQAEQAERLHLRIPHPDDPVFAIFEKGEYGDPARGVVTARLHLDPAVAAPGRTLLEYADGVPALVRFARPGHLYLWNLPLDAAASDWAAQPEFVPFLGELLLQARDAGAASRLVPEAFPGDVLTWRSPQDVAPEEVRLETAAGAALHLDKDLLADGVSFTSCGIEVPGLYTWRFQGKENGLRAVNFPEVESDLRGLSPAEIQQKGLTVVASVREMQQLRAGVDLWPTLLGVALVLLLVESLAMVWVGRS